MGSSLDAKTPEVFRTGLFLSLLAGLAASVIIWLEIGGLARLAAIPVDIVIDTLDIEPGGMAWTMFATILIYVLWGLVLSGVAYGFQRFTRATRKKSKVVK